MIRVLLADDEQLIREGLRLILDLQPDIEVIGEAADGVEALRLVPELRPDLLLIDIRMPRLDGLEVTERLAEADVRPRILILTTFDSDEYLYRALKAGASGFLLKDVPRGQLLHAVRVVAAGDELLSPVITRRLVERFMSSPAAAAGAVQLHRLTPRETDVLRLVAGGMSNAEIATTLFLSEATVKTHLAHVFTKLDLRDRAQAVVIAYESGLVRAGRPA
jgi:DNA-binding NarL/FixJ family response regulator